MKKLVCFSVLLFVGLMLYAQRPWQMGYDISLYQEAPNFKVKMTNGKTLELKKLKGKVVFLDFGSLYCPPCLKAQKTFREKLLNKYSEKELVVIPVMGPACKSWEELNAFRKQHGLDFPFAWDKDREIKGYMKTSAVPRWFVINRFGVLTAMGDSEDFSQAVEEAVRQTKDVKSRTIKGGVFMITPDVGKKLVTLRSHLIDAVIEAKDPKAGEFLQVLNTAKKNGHKVEMQLEERTLNVLSVQELQEPEFDKKPKVPFRQEETKKEYGQGIRFQELTLEQALAQAKAENKRVFLDFYTTWCGPCKRMDKNVFPLKSVGDYFNSRFITMKFDAEKGEGKVLAQRYGVNCYPTYFILNADGSVYHRLSGGRNEEQFIQEIDEVLADRTKTILYLDSLYDSGTMPRSMYRTYIHATAHTGDARKTAALINELRGKIGASEKLHPDHWAVLENARMGSEDFNFVLGHQEELRESVGEEKVDFFFYYNFSSQMDFLIVQCRSSKVLEGMASQFRAIAKVMEQADFKRKNDLQEVAAFVEAGIQGDGAQVSEWIRKLAAGNNSEGINAMIYLTPVIGSAEDIGFVLAKKEELLSKAALESVKPDWEQCFRMYGMVLNQRSVKE